MLTIEDRYEITDTLSLLAQRFDIALHDHEMNKLIHHVADMVERASSRSGDA